MSQEIKFRKLEVKDVDASFRLQEVVSADLDDDKKLFILPKTKKQMECYIEKEGMAFGCFIGDTLVSHIYFAFLDEDGSVSTQIDWLDNNPDFLEARRNTAMPKAAETHPLWRGHGFMSQLLDYAFAEIQKYGRDELITDIAFFNEDSISVFMKKNFRMVAVDHPEDDIELGIFYRDMNYKKVTKVVTDHLEIIDMFDYDGVSKAIDNGYYPTFMTKNKEYKLMSSAIISEKRGTSARKFQSLSVA
jgi:GNAT superfamily N-acetyltransferase